MKHNCFAVVFLVTVKKCLQYGSEGEKILMKREIARYFYDFGTFIFWYIFVITVFANFTITVDTGELAINNEKFS
jgi:hypothetical protein